MNADNYKFVIFVNINYHIFIDINILLAQIVIYWSNCNCQGKDRKTRLFIKLKVDFLGWFGVIIMASIA